MYARDIFGRFEESCHIFKEVGEVNGAKKNVENVKISLSSTCSTRESRHTHYIQPMPCDLRNVITVFSQFLGLLVGILVVELVAVNSKMLC